MTMTERMGTIIVTALCIIAYVTPASLDAAPPTAPQMVKVKSVPKNLLADMKSYMTPKGNNKGRRELYARMDAQLAKLLEMGAKTELEYAGAGNLSRVRDLMLQAAMYREQIKPNQSDREKATLAIADRILASPGDVNLKVKADVLVTRRKLNDAKGKPAAVSEKLIRDLYTRYKGGPAEAGAVIEVTSLAMSAKLNKLVDEMLDVMEKKYPLNPRAINFLINAGRGPNFTAELTKLDGSILKLPDDLLGKVVVVDFWATWCPPCVRAIPHMKTTYAKYKGRGVEFVGISLDNANSKKKLASFVETNHMGWIHTYSGKKWADPVRKQYGVSGIPSVWVVDKNGRIVSSNALSNLEATLNKALAIPVKKTRQ